VLLVVLQLAWPLIRWMLRLVGRLVRYYFLHILPAFIVWVFDLAITPLVVQMPQYYLPPLHPHLKGGAKGWGQWFLASTHRDPNFLWHFWVAQIHHPSPPWLLLQAPFAALIIFLLTWRPRKPRGLRTSPEATHGSARWRLQLEMARTFLQTSTEKPTKAGIVVGSQGNRCWVANPEIGNPHVLLVGATRSGKTRRDILPTVWVLGHAKQSMVLTDPKGELHAHTAAWLRQQGYDVRLIDLLRPTRGNRWNPLAAIRASHDAGDAEEASRLAWELGNVLASDVSAGTDPIWPQAEESLIAALALGAALEAPAGARHPATMYRLLSELGGDGEGGKALDEWFRSLGHDHPARRAYGTAALSESRTRSSIYTGTAAHLRTFGDPGIAWLTAESDHDPADVGRRPTAVFLLLPDEGGARNSVAALYVSQLYSALVGVARDQGGRLPVPVSFLLDEAGNIGRIPDLDRKLTVAAGRGIRFLLALQGFSQLGRYGRDAQQTILGNCDTWIYLRTADVETAKVISAKLGSFTVQTTSRSKVARSGGSTLSASEGAVGRALLMPDEVLRWPGGNALIIQSGEYPAQLPLQDLSDWRKAAAAFVPAAPTTAPPLGSVCTWSPWAQTPAVVVPTPAPAPIPAPVIEGVRPQDNPGQGVPANPFGL